MKAHLIPAIVFSLGLISLLVLFNISPHFFYRQLGFLVIGGIILALLSAIKPHIFIKYSLVIYVAVSLLLLISLIGGGGRGTHRWISLFGFSFQASQLAIPLVGLWLAQLIHFKGIKTLKSLFIVLFYALVPAFLIFIEPDLGTTLWFLLPVGVLFFVGGIKLKHLLLLIFLGLVGVVFGFLFLLKPYQKERILSFAQPKTQKTSEMSASEYNRRQALIAVGSGGIWGKGFGLGTQSQLKFLPEKHTDFVFATLVEEGGLVAGLIVIGLYLFLIFFLFHQAFSLDGVFKLFTVYTASLLAWQVIINLGGNLGLMPITGLPLPFLSYGGSSILSWSIALGIIISMIKNTTHQNKNL